LDCGQHSLIENNGFLPGIHCSNLASVLCLTSWPKYVPSTCIILSRFINTQGDGSVIGVLWLLDILSDWQESAGIGWCVFWGITTVAIVFIFNSKYCNLLNHRGYCLYHCCNIQELLHFANTVYICCFNWHAMKYSLFFVCVCVCARVRENKLMKYAHVFRHKDKDINQYKNCSTVHSLHFTAISIILTGKSTE
jgi:hypothetical protein